MQRLEYKWLVGIASVFGIFMELLDMTIVNVAVPNLQREFNVEINTIEWVVTGYLLSLAVFIPAAGYLADRFGSKRMYLTALFLFTGASALCGLAWNVESLIAFRVLQGMGGGMLAPVGFAMLFRAFPPEERATASAVFAIPTVLAPALGPIAGGALVEYLDWRWIFWINLPVGVAGLLFCWRALREHREPQPGSFDPAGFLLSAAGFSLLVYGLSVAAERDQGLDSPRALAFMAAGALTVAALALVELRVRQPMFDVRLLKDRTFAMMNGVIFVVFVGVMGGLFLYPLFLQNPQLKGLSPLESGLTTFPQAIGVGLIMPLAGRFFNRIGGKPMVIAGTTIIALTTLMFTQLDVTTSAWLMRGTLVLLGMGMGLVFVSVQALAFYNIPGQSMARASSLFNVTRQISGSFGVAVMATALSNRVTHHMASGAAPQRALVSGFQDAFAVAAFLTLFGVVVALFLRTPKPAAGTGDGAAEREMAAVH